MKKYIVQAFLVFMMTSLFLITGGGISLADEQKPAAAATTDQAAPAEEKPTGSFAVSVLSKYIWRRYENTKNSIVVQPSMTVGYKGFTANI
jgi:hypothetical protein